MPEQETIVATKNQVPAKSNGFCRSDASRDLHTRAKTSVAAAEKLL